MLAWQDIGPICLTMFHPGDRQRFPNTSGTLPPGYRLVPAGWGGDKEWLEQNDAWLVMM
jgi:hypothetical protein